MVLKIKKLKIFQNRKKYPFWPQNISFDISEEILKFSEGCLFRFKHMTFGKIVFFQFFLLNFFVHRIIEI